MIMGDVCDVIISHCSSRFAVTGHLVAATKRKELERE